MCVFVNTAAPLRDVRPARSSRGVTTVAAVPREPIDRPEPLVMTTARVPRSLMRETRALVALEGSTLQDFVIDAMRRELTHRQRRAAQRASNQMPR